MPKTGLVVAAAVVTVGVAGGVYFARAKTDVQKFRTEKIDRGDVTATVTAAGTMSAVTTVAVGSQVSGIVAHLYANFNSRVKKGQPLADLDPTPFEAAVNQSLANLQKAKVDLRAAEINFGRQKKLLDLQLIAQSDFDAAQATRDDAAAAVAQQQAALEQAQTNLRYSKIASPIDGIVVNRAYDVGQTVAASFQAPTLFTIAQDLTKMQVQTNIDEADIGGVKVGQVASFTVDAFPDQTFSGTVSEIRLSTQTVQNVVTYPVLIDVANLEDKLKPGMTANVKIPVNTRKSVLRVPNAALRFKPDEADVLRTPADKQAGQAAKGGGAPPAAAPGAPVAREPGEARGEGPGGFPGAGGGPGGDGVRRGGPGGPGGGGPGAYGQRRQGGAARGATVYLELPNGKLRPVAVRTSITDGSYTAVFADQLKPGDAVVIGLATARAGAPATPQGGPRGFRL